MKPTTNPNGKAAAGGDLEQARLDEQVRNEELAERLFAYQSRNQLSDERLGKLLASSGTYVSRYRNRQFTGDIFKFETAIHELLMKEELMEGDATKLSAEGFCVRSVHGFLDFVTVNRMLGVGHGPAGKGKTCAARLYAANHTRSVYLHVWDWTSSRDKLVAELARAARVRRSTKETLAEALVRTFRDSDRLIIFDNGQRLTERCRKFLCDFYDATRTPIALLGNPEIVGQFERNDQHKSRLGRCVNVTLSEAEHLAEIDKMTVLTLVETHFPAAKPDKEALSLCLDMLRERDGGASRLCRNVLRLADRCTRADSQIPPAKAIRLAQTQLTRNAA